MVTAARAFIGNHESRLASGSVNAMRWRMEDGTWAATSPLAVGIPLVHRASLNPCLTQLPQLVDVVLPTHNGVTIRKRCNSLEMAKSIVKTRACSR